MHDTASRGRDGGGGGGCNFVGTTCYFAATLQGFLLLCVHHWWQIYGLKVEECPLNAQVTRSINGGKSVGFENGNLQAAYTGR